MFRLIQKSFNSRLGEAPRACVQWLLLCPYDCLSVGVLIKILAELSPREGIELLDACDGYVVEIWIRSAVLVQSDVYLTRAEDDAVNFRMRFDVT